MCCLLESTLQTLVHRKRPARRHKETPWHPGRPTFRTLRSHSTCATSHGSSSSRSTSALGGTTCHTWHRRRPTSPREPWLRPWVPQGRQGRSSEMAGGARRQKDLPGCTRICTYTLMRDCVVCEVGHFLSVSIHGDRWLGWRFVLSTPLHPQLYFLPASS